MKALRIVICALSAIELLTGCQGWPDEAALKLQLYHTQIDSLRHLFRTKQMPQIRFFLFGMGNRAKLIYKSGCLRDANNGDTLKYWNIREDLIVPNDYRVILQTNDNQKIQIYENEKGVFISENNRITAVAGTQKLVHLSDFKGHPYSEVLKVLHQEILINILESEPVPNCFVYKKAWRRDGAMMAMCLEKTGNTGLIKDWVLGLNDPYDHNNEEKTGHPENEADNLGQSLYLLSLFTDQTYPLVNSIMLEAKKFEKKSREGIYINGRTDGHETPVYQTKWLKFGMKRMRMHNPYIIPVLPDDYSSLFWWDYKKYHTSPIEEYNDDFYPYLQWARDHFCGTHSGPLSSQDYPLTWETLASEADYSKMAIIDSVFATQRTAAPHTWHASEIFLYLIDLKTDSIKLNKTSAKF